MDTDPPLGPKRPGHRHKPQQKASGRKSSTCRVLTRSCIAPAPAKKAKPETAVSKGHTATRAEA